MTNQDPGDQTYYIYSDKEQLKEQKYRVLKKLMAFLQELSEARGDKTRFRRAALEFNREFLDYNFDPKHRARK